MNQTNQLSVARHSDTFQWKHQHKLKIFCLFSLDASGSLTVSRLSSSLQFQMSLKSEWSLFWSSHQFSDWVMVPSGGQLWILTNAEFTMIVCVSDSCTVKTRRIWHSNCKHSQIGMHLSLLITPGVSCVVYVVNVNIFETPPLKTVLHVLRQWMEIEPMPHHRRHRV